MSLSSLPLRTTASVIAVVRDHYVSDVAALCAALAEGGIHCVELNAALPELPVRLASVAAWPDLRVGVGAVLTARQVEEAAEAGAAFLVAPNRDPQVARAARRLGLPVVLGALTPDDIAEAWSLGASAAKVFPASAFGPAYFREMGELHPHLPLLAAGGVDAANAADYLAQGAAAVCVGPDIVSTAAIAAGDWDEITRRARKFTAGLPRAARPRAPLSGAAPW